MSVGIPVCTPSPQLPCFGVNFRVRGLIRLVSKGMETHLSCQIQLCALLAFKRREIFHFPHFSVGFFVFFLHPSSSFHRLLFTLFSPLSCCYAPVFFFFFWFSLWVWLKVILHTGSLSERREGGSDAGEKDKGEQ